MTKPKIHIICLDAPSPPDYGGAIDMYYKIKALAETGTSIILHYFQYKRNRNAGELEEICEEVYAYKRKKTFSLTLPFIVYSRVNKDLIKRLNEDDHPIIFEGLHTTGIIPYLKADRHIVIRIHNNESVYYKKLSEVERSLTKRTYYKAESSLLEKYQKELNKKLTLACISEDDIKDFTQLGFKKVVRIPAFIPFENVDIKEGNGDYCLYHGNLEINENSIAVEWLLYSVFSFIDIPFIVAGRNIPVLLKEKAKNLPHIKFVNNPSDEKLEALIQNAQVNVLPSFNETGIKLKLLHALLKGRHCLINKQGVAGSGLEEFCHMADSPKEFILSINTLMPQSLTNEENTKRLKILDLYNNKVNAETLSSYLH